MRCTLVAAAAAASIALGVVVETDQRAGEHVVAGKDADDRVERRLAGIDGHPRWHVDAQRVQMLGVGWENAVRRGRALGERGCGGGCSGDTCENRARGPCPGP